MRRRSSWALPIASCVVLVTVLSGCGDGEDAGAGPIETVDVPGSVGDRTALPSEENSLAVTAACDAVDEAFGEYGGLAEADGYFEDFRDYDDLLLRTYGFLSGAEMELLEPVVDARSAYNDHIESDDDDEVEGMELSAELDAAIAEFAAMCDAA